MRAAFTGAGSLARARTVLAGRAAGRSGFVAATSADSTAGALTVEGAIAFDQLSRIAGPVTTPSATTPTRPAVHNAAFPPVMHVLLDQGSGPMPRASRAPM